MFLYGPFFDASRPVFFLRYIPQNGGRQNVQVRKMSDFSDFKRLYLLSETVSEEKSQGKNENFSAANKEEEKTRVSVSSDRSPQKGVFRIK